jgi:L-amino acid N-acyltransferase YncA
MPSHQQEPIIRVATSADAPTIARIYNHYVTNTVVTFEEEPVAAAEMGRRLEEGSAAALPWLTIETDHVIMGYAYATPWRTRRGYRFSAEITVYLAPDQGGRGLGSRLYAQLFPMLQARGIHAVIGGIALPNAASVALHEKFGMRQVAHFSEVGFKLDRWIDVGYWQRTF